jgi:hypothetical protein
MPANDRFQASFWALSRNDRIVVIEPGMAALGAKRAEFLQGQPTTTGQHAGSFKHATANRMHYVALFTWGNSSLGR